MSIAVSADIKPSRLLLVVMATLSAGFALGGVAAGLLLTSRWSLWWRLAIVLITVLVAAIGFYCVLRSRRTVWLHISGTGQIRLVEHRQQGNAKLARQVMKGGLAQLLPGSTIWSGLLLLRLRLEGGGTRIVPILPDSVSKETFKALKVACRWAASHNNQVIEHTIHER